MTGKLAVIVPDIGVASETFVRRHVQDLWPGGVVVVAARTSEGKPRNWKADCPILEIGGLKYTWEGTARLAARKLGVPTADIALRATERFLKKHNVQVILGEYLDQSLQWLPIAQRLGIRFFGHAHGYDVSRRLREEKWRTEYLRYNESGGIIAMNQVARARLVALGISEFKIHVIPYGVDVPNEPKERVAKEMLRCLAVGRMVPKKAPILTLDAFRRAVEACPTLRLDYVGTGELLPAARQFVQAFDLGDKVTLHREQPSEVVDRLMGESDIFLQHSMTDPDTGNEEGLPVAILEAMAQSLPVVSTRHAGIPEAVIDGVTGCLVDEGDSITMGERIISLARDHNLRLKFGAAGWQCAKERFTWEIERASLLEVMGFAK